MPVARELIESRGNRLEESGRTDLVRVFQAEANPDNLTAVTGLPNIGDVFPGFPPPGPGVRTPRCYDRDIEYERGSGSSDGAGGRILTIRLIYRYSTEPPTWGGGNPSDPFFKSWTLSYFTIEQAIPYAIEHQNKYHYVNNLGQNVSVNEYPIHGTSFFEARKRFIRRVRIQNMTSAQWEAINIQQNVLHRIVNRWYLFTIGDIIEQARNVWDVQYTWEYDGGTFDQFSLGQPHPRIRFPSNMTVSQIPLIPGTFMRPPYHMITTMADVDVNGFPTWPIFLATCPYQVNQDGHLSLPGFTL